VFGVLPGSLQAVDPFVPAGPLMHANMPPFHRIRRVLGLLPRRGGVDEKPAWPLVMIDGASFRLVVGGVADFVRGNIQVVVEEEPNLTVRSEEHTSELQSRVDLVCR